VIPTTIIRILNKRSIWCISLVIFVFFLCNPYKLAFSYIMPPTQILELMLKNFLSLDTMEINQWVRVSEPGNEDEEELIEEEVWLKRPWFFSCEKVESSETASKASLMTRCGWCNVPKYQCIFLEHRLPEFVGFLARLGVETSMASLTHIGPKIAYLIGQKGKPNSYLIVSRDKFLPLVLHIGLISSKGPFTVRFEDYRQVAKGWYPSRIICEFDHRRKEEYVAQTIRANITIDPLVFRPSPEPGEPRGPQESGQIPVDDGLKGVIKTLKEKYQ